MNKIILSLTLLLTFCLLSCDEEWATVFYDNFNRADGSPGQNWTVHTESNASLEIKDNRILYSYPNLSTNMNDSYAGMTYVKSIEATKIRISSRFITGSDIDSVECLGFQIFNTMGTGHFTVSFQRDFFAIIDSSNNPLAVENISLTNDVDQEYILEAEIDEGNAIARLKDTDENTLYEISASVDLYNGYSATIIFMGKDLTSSSIDDFEIQVSRENFE